MGLFGSSERWRRQVVALHRAWLAAPRVRAADMLLDGAPLPRSVRPSAAMGALTCEDCEDAVARVATAARGASRVYLVCSTACSCGRLCHGELIAERLRAALAADAV